MSEVTETTVPLTKVDSAIGGLTLDDKAPAPSEKEVEKGHKRRSSQGKNVWNIKDLEDQKIEIELPIETQKTGWKLNTSPNSIEDKDILKMYLVTPPDALDAIYKQFKKKADDEMDKPYLAGFEWDKEECWTRLIVHQKKEGQPSQPSGKKSKKKNKEEA
ncbi:hypothetical protein N7532_000215 [Penicillium argentinense]|uniref:Uncharacterized protein n=1 Tax=Penicillium argentinense TaxID=1131581 RepID=A0A9W9KN18_9EURO|nr:uncharacterized protein N7532_000215 [Penicillium argentinense]KAJ5112170.1 hypothetical protein N7532_000215 [Penicillium argentinense]